MPFWMINRRLPWTGREHEEVRDTLLQQRLIEYQLLKPGPKGGRPTAGYRLAALPPATTDDEGRGNCDSCVLAPALAGVREDTGGE